VQLARDVCESSQREIVMRNALCLSLLLSSTSFVERRLQAADEINEPILDGREERIFSLLILDESDTRESEGDIGSYYS